MSNIWFTSDTHYNHQNIVRGVSKWKDVRSGGYDQFRDFDTLEEHNETLVKNINSLVKPQDTLYHLGDVAFGGHHNIKVFLDQLECKNVHLIYGNHDHHIKEGKHPYKELFKSTQDVLEITLPVEDRKQRFFLSHFSHQVWNQHHHGVIHLFGHSHGSLKGLGRSMDVGVDTHNLYPYHLDEILYEMRDVSPHLVDHHNETTN